MWLMATILYSVVTENANHIIWETSPHYQPHQQNSTYFLSEKVFVSQEQKIMYTMITIMRAFYKDVLYKMGYQKQPNKILKVAKGYKFSVIKVLGM